MGFATYQSVENPCQLLRDWPLLKEKRIATAIGMKDQAR
jgi:hypothetical protein